MKSRKNISEEVLFRLSAYLSALSHLDDAGEPVTSSKKLGKITGFTPALIRRDLSYFGGFGKQGKGYEISHLKKQISHIMNLTQEHPVLLAGAGNLGRALIGYQGFKKLGFVVCALFDSDEKIIGKKILSHKVQDIKYLAEANKKCRAKIGVITVPAAAAQDVAEKMVLAGVTCILNFAPTQLDVPPHVHMRNVDLARQLEILAYYL